MINDDEFEKFEANVSEIRSEICEKIHEIFDKHHKADNCYLGTQGRVYEELGIWCLYGAMSTLRLGGTKEEFIRKRLEFIFKYVSKLKDGQYEIQKWEQDE